MNQARIASGAGFLECLMSDLVKSRETWAPRHDNQMSQRPLKLHEFGAEICDLESCLSLVKTVAILIDESSQFISKEKK